MTIDPLPESNTSPATAQSGDCGWRPRCHIRPGEAYEIRITDSCCGSVDVVRPGTTMTADLQAEVRRRQHARLERKGAARAAPGGGRSPWAHVPLAELFREAGNAVLETGNEQQLETGHQPFHGSKSGRCVRVDTTAGRWYCRGCRRGGDALTFWMAKTGLARRQAAAERAERFGPPAGRRRRGAIVIRWTEV